LIRDHGNCFNEFLDCELNEFKHVNWEHRDIILHNKFKNHTVDIEDIAAYGDDYSWDETVNSKKVELKTFKTAGWTIGNTWIDELFEQEEFVINFNRAEKLLVESNLEYLTLRNRAGSVIKEYERHCKLF
jgi:hypothetical protein